MPFETCRTARLRQISMGAPGPLNIQVSQQFSIEVKSEQLPGMAYKKIIANLKKLTTLRVMIIVHLQTVKNN